MTIDYYPQPTTLPSSSILRTPTHSRPLTVTQSHPQLRDLVVLPWEQPGHVTAVCHDSLVTHHLREPNAAETTRLKFAPCSVSYGMGLIGAGGQVGELALRSATKGAQWCYQTLPSSPTSSINNALFIHPSPLPSSRSTPRVLVSNNARLIEVFNVKGAAPDAARARQRRKRKRWARPDDSDGELNKAEEDELPEEEGVEETGPCELEKVTGSEVYLSTQVNHCSVSPDGRRMVAVGDTNEVFLFDVSAGSGQYLLTHVFPGPADASFSTDWSTTGQHFAVASQDGSVSIFDVRSLPPTLADDRFGPSSGGARRPKRVAEIRSLQPRAAGAARKVKFAPPSWTGGAPLLGFTEHRSLFHVVDARTYESMQTVDVPAVFAQTSAAFPGQAWDDSGVQAAQASAQRAARWAYYRPPSGAEQGRAGGGGLEADEYLRLVPGLPGGASSGRAQSTWERARAAASDYVRVSSQGWSAPNGGGLDVPLPSETTRMEVHLGGSASGGGGGGGGVSRWRAMGPTQRASREVWETAMGGGDRTAQVWLIGADTEGDERDVVGFDWHEDGSGGVVALGKGVVEWEVDQKAARCEGTWAFA